MNNQENGGAFTTRAPSPDHLRVVPEETYRGEGISMGLARGLLVYYDGLNLTGEGMGIGNVAVRDGTFTYFSRTSTDSVKGDGIRRTFQIDTCMKWAICGKTSGFLTQGVESAIGAYKRFPRIQRFLMKPVFPFRALTGIHPVFEEIPPFAEIVFEYVPSGSNVDISVNIKMNSASNFTISILNELSGNWFTKTGTGGYPGRDLSAWEAVNPGSFPISLFDLSHNITFSLVSFSTANGMPVSVYQGREQGTDLSWAGFCLEVPIRKPSGEFPIRYRVRIAEGGTHGSG